MAQIKGKAANRADGSDEDRPQITPMPQIEDRPQMREWF